MNFSSNDKKILVGSFMLIIFMSLVFPALGMTSDGASQNNVPELDVSKNTWEIVGDRPAYPSSPTSGELRYTTDRVFNIQDVLLRDDDDVIFMETLCWNNSPSTDDCQVQLSVFDDDDFAEVDEYILNESDFDDRNVILLEQDNNESETWEVRVEFQEASNWGTDDVDYRMNWQIVERPDPGDSFLANIPVIGGVYSTISDEAAVGAWFVTMIFWISVWFVDLVINAIIIFLTLIFFGVDIITFMTSNYSNMISNTSGFTSFILLIPFLLLNVMLLKLGFIFIKSLPTT